MINAIKSIFNAISGFFAFVNGTLLPKSHELISAVGDAVEFLGDASAKFFTSAPGIFGTIAAIVIVITIAKLIGGRQ